MLLRTYTLRTLLLFGIFFGFYPYCGQPIDTSKHYFYFLVCL
jgi:hypothetical protein